MKVAALIKPFLNEFRRPRKGPEKSEYLFRDDVGSTLAEAFHFLTPLIREFATRTLVLQTTTNWTAFFNNRAGDQIDVALNQHLSASLNTRAIMAFHKDDTVRKLHDRVAGVPGGTIFHFYEAGVPMRQLSCINDSPWSFDHFGEPLPFERIERYSAKKKRDRFDFELLKDYLGEFNLFPYDDSFFRVDDAHPGMGIEFKTSDPSIILTPVTLEEFRRQEEEPIG